MKLSSIPTRLRSNKTERLNRLGIEGKGKEIFPTGEKITEIP